MFYEETQSLFGDNLVNFYFDDDRGFAHESTLALFKEIAAGKYEAFTSTYVTDELENASAVKRDKMLGLIIEYDIAVLSLNDEAVRLADIYVEEGMIPRKSYGGGGG